MAIETADFDGQDQAELFDEDNVEGIDALQEGSTFEDIPDVYDATQKLGDGDEDLTEFDAADFDVDLVDDEDLEEEDEVIDDDVYDETDEEDVVDRDLLDHVAAAPRDEVDLVYQPDVDGRRGARGGAGGYEARGVLDEDDLEDLGYADLEEEEEEEERTPAARRSRNGRTPREPKSFKGPDAAPVRVDREQDAPHACAAAEPMAEDACFDQMGVNVKPDETRQEALIDEAVEETFPASDPISPKHIT
jgi:hypothetical protein